jgi:hypothetical protein
MRIGCLPFHIAKARLDSMTGILLCLEHRFGGNGPQVL